MKKIISSISILIIALSAPLFSDTSADKPKIAVYVTGGNNQSENDALGAQLLNAVVSRGQYTAIERTDVFLAEIDREQVKQRSGAIDDAQISRLGMQAGVQYVLVAVITQAFDAYQVSARILDVETAKVIAASSADGRRLRSMSDLNKFASRVVDGMFGSESVRRVKFGARLAYNNSFVPGMVVDITGYDDDRGIWEESYDSKSGMGHGFGLGGVVLFNVWEQVHVNAGVDLIFRTPIVTDVSATTEFALGLPVLVRWDVMGSPLFVEGGVQVDIPFGTSVKWDWDKNSESVWNRNSADVGIAVGAGYFVTPNISVDIRTVIGLTSFDDVNDGALSQVCVGVSWVW
jgi:TolB-like protein